MINYGRRPDPRSAGTLAVAQGIELSSSPRLIVLAGSDLRVTPRHFLPTYVGVDVSLRVPEAGSPERQRRDDLS